jgi:translation initiation factor 2D
MAIPSNRLTAGGTEKGKAVLVAHAWRDHLWEMGSKPDVPEDTVLGEQKPENEGAKDQEDGDEVTPVPPSEIGSGEPSQEVSYSTQEVSELLAKSLLQAISTSLSSAPPSAFPIPATLFYTNHILPSRPAFPTLVLAPSSHPDEADKIHVDPQEINIKASSHKSLTAFLKAMDKLSLLSLKQPQKHSQQPDSLVMSVNAKNPLVLGHTSFPTVRDIETKAAKKAAREEKEKQGENSHELVICELWKPHQTIVDLFKGLGGELVLSPPSCGLA